MARTIATLVATALTCAAVFFLGLSGWMIAAGFDAGAGTSSGTAMTVSGAAATIGLACVGLAAFLWHALTGTRPPVRR